MPPAPSGPPAQTLDYPRVGLTLEVSREHDRIVRVGFVRPESLRALRETVLAAVERSSPAGEGSSAEFRHALNNLLNRVTLGFHLFQKQMEAGAHELAEQAFHRVCSDLDSLEYDWGLGGEDVERAGQTPCPDAPVGGSS
ncbi:MAG: hypothetical protein U0835_05745 [Isosphaeraceae bacterium]